MRIPKDIKEQKALQKKIPATKTGSLIEGLQGLQGNRVLNRILNQKDPGAVVQALPSQDFYWVLKKVGEDDCLPLLELGSEAQWQYLLDLEIWKKDRLDMGRTASWVKRLMSAAPQRLARWFIKEGQLFAYHHLFKNIEVVVVSEEDHSYNIPKDYFSLDGVIHIRVKDPEYREALEHLIRQIAHENFERGQALILGLAGVLPAELEEEMYRLRSIRLSEHGFLPYEEALSVYSPLEPEAFDGEEVPALPAPVNQEDRPALVPFSPLSHIQSTNLLTETLGRIADPFFMDRLRMEFAGLCNEILSADQTLVEDLDTLIGTCRRAAGCVNLAIDRLCGRDLKRAETLLKHHPLVSLFRLGFGLALKLKWKAGRWITRSWFYHQGLDHAFWGEAWGGVLSGILAGKPKRYAGFEQGEEFKEFEWLSEILAAGQVLERLQVLDRLIENLISKETLKEPWFGRPDITFRPFLFHYWARGVLKLKPSVSPLKAEQAVRLFRKLLGEGKKPPHAMGGFEKTFVQALMDVYRGGAPEETQCLHEALIMIWKNFCEEHAWVSLEDLDPKYSNFILIAEG